MNNLWENTNDFQGFLIFLVVGYIIYIFLTGKTDKPENRIINNQKSLEREQKINEIFEKRKKEELHIEKLKIDHKEIVYKIEQLELESYSDFEKERKNSIEIDRLKLKLVQIEDTVGKKSVILELLRRDLLELGVDIMKS